MRDFEPIGVVIAQIKQLQGRLLQRLIRDNPKMAAYELNSGQINLMYQLWMEDNITISRLSEKTLLANTTLTNMLDRLEEQGMVKRVVNHNNRREVLIRLTQSGKYPKEDSNKIIEIMRNVNFRGFTQDEIEAVEGYLERMKDNLEAFAKERNV